MTLTPWQVAARRTQAPQKPLSRPQLALAQSQVELGELRFFKGHVVALKVGAAVQHGGIEEQGKKRAGVVGIVNGLHLLVKRP